MFLSGAGVWVWVGWLIFVLAILEGGWAGALGICALGDRGSFSHTVLKLSLKKNSKSFSLHSRFLCLSNAVYNYSLPLLRSNLVSVHLQLDRQHRSIQVGHVSWPPFGAALLNQRQSQSSLLYFISISSISMFGIISLSSRFVFPSRYSLGIYLSPFSLLCSSWVLTSCFPPVLTILSLF